MQESPPYKIIADTPHYLAVDKAAGISFHNDDNNKDSNSAKGILNLIREKEYSTQKSSNSKKENLFAVHRLDKLSSGVLIFAKGRKNADFFSNLFRHRKLEKIYIAISDRLPKKKQGTVSGGMKPSRGGSWQLTHENKNIAITKFFSVLIPNRRIGLRLYVLQPLSGRTHQIRVAMKSLGAPILGDSRYASFALARQEDRCYLHAYGLRFYFENKLVTIISPPNTGTEYLSHSFQNVLTGIGDLFGAMQKAHPSLGKAVKTKSHL